MSYKPNTYIDDVAFKQALTSYNEKIKNTYTDIPKEDSSVDYRYLVGVTSPTGAGEENSQSYKSSSLKYSEDNKKLEVPNLLVTTDASVTGGISAKRASIEETVSTNSISADTSSVTGSTFTGSISIKETALPDSLSISASSAHVADTILVGGDAAGITIDTTSIKVSGADADTVVTANGVTTKTVTADSATLGSASISGSVEAGNAIITNGVSAGSASISGSVSANSATIKNGEKTTTIAPDKVTTEVVEADFVTICGSNKLSVIGAVDTSAEIADFNASTPAEI